MRRRIQGKTYEAKIIEISLIILTLASVVIAIAPLTLAQTISTAENPVGITDIGIKILGAGLAVGLACLGSGIAMGIAGSATVGVVGEKPELFGQTFIYIVFCEAIAIYGLVVAFMILGGM